MKRREFLQAVGLTAAAGAIAEAAIAQGSKVIAEEMMVPASDRGNVDRADDYQALLKKGYGHIGRIGFLSPGIVDETLSGQWYRMAPHGVTLVRTSLELKDVTVEEVNAALARTEKASTELGKYRPDCIIFGGSPTVAVAGHGFEKSVVEKIEKGKPLRLRLCRNMAHASLLLRRRFPTMLMSWSRSILRNLDSRY